MSATLPVPHSVRRLRQKLRNLPGNTSGRTFRERRSEARRLMANASRLLEAGDSLEAETLAIEAIVLAPGWAETVYLLGRILEVQGLIEEAIACHRGNLPARFSSTYADVVTALDTAAPQGKATASEVTAGMSAAMDRTVVFEASRIDLPAPGQVAAQAPRVLERRQIAVAACHVDRIVGGELWQEAHNTLVRDATGRVIDAHTMGNSELVQILMASHDAVDLGERVILLGARGSGNYYHWMTDILPKLELCRRSGITLRPADRVLLPTYRSSFQVESLARLGVKEKQIIFADQVSPYVTAREVIAPCLSNAMATTMGRWLPAFLKKAFLPPGNRPAASRRIFVSRHAARSQGRAIENLEEVETFFADRGFDIVYPETLDIQAQAHLFAESTLVAAPHGAGLTNLVFCASGTRIIEFYGAHLAPCYHAMSALCGLRYYAHHCADHPSDHGTDAGECEFDRARTLAARRTAGFSIDTEAISALLDFIDPAPDQPMQRRA